MHMEETAVIRDSTAPKGTGGHMEPHASGTTSAFVRDVIIGMSDGLTVPFAMAAGLASTGVPNMTIVIAAMLAEIAGGSVSMGLGGYLAAQTEREHYFAERAREAWEVDNKPETEEQEVVDALMEYGLTREESRTVADSLKQRKEDWINFMMRYELGLEEPHPGRAWKSAGTIAGAYVIGGLIPLMPYLFTHSLDTALLYSVVLTLAALLVFGYLRGRFLRDNPFKSMLYTAGVGAVAASAAFLLTKLVS